MGDMKYVGSEMKACGWRDKCGIISKKSVFFSSTECHQEIKTKQGQWIEHLFNSLQKPTHVGSIRASTLANALSALCGLYLRLYL